MPDYSKRVKEFVWYHINGDGDCNGQVLREYAQKNHLNQQDCFDLAYFYATTYCCVSAVFLLNNRDRIKNDCRNFASEYKSKLIFQSDRKYVKMHDTFYKMLDFWQKNLQTASELFKQQYVQHGILNTGKALSACEKWYYFRRFSAYLFVETYCDILRLDATRETGMQYEGDNMTFIGGLCYVYEMDTYAKFVQDNRKLPLDRSTIDYMISNLQETIKASGGDDNLTKLETSLCAYEKFFKATRYNGFYADRQLQEINKLIAEPEFSSTCKAVLAARDVIPDCYRGEKFGWSGIRTQLKKSYLATGVIQSKYDV